MRKTASILWILIFLLIFFVGYAYAQKITINEIGEVIQQTPEGAINWSKGVITAVGYASPDQEVYAQKVAAEASARANLIMVLGELTIKRGITVKRGKLEGDINIQSVEGMLKGSFVGTPTKQLDGSVAVTAYKKLTPELISELLPVKYLKQKSSVVNEETKLSVGQPKVASKPITGLIIDTKGLGVVPSLVFRILIEGTQEILYGHSKDSRIKIIRERGMASYARSVENAKQIQRVGERPLVVKAVGLSGKTDLYVSKKDAVKIYSANLENPFFKDMKVVVVCGE